MKIELFLVIRHKDKDAENEWCADESLKTGEKKLINKILDNLNNEVVLNVKFQNK